MTLNTTAAPRPRPKDGAGPAHAAPPGKCELRGKEWVDGGHVARVARAPRTRRACSNPAFPQTCTTSQS